jgi:diadenosine tetraphosphate (Ap4A) HIT family hydrolase
MQNCIFCKIIERELPATIVAETEWYIIIKDISPKAPVHNLIIPKKHIADVISLEEGDVSIPGMLFLAAQQLAKELPDPQAFRLIVNNGADAGQSVFHMHIHFLSGKRMLDF